MKRASGVGWREVYAIQAAPGHIKIGHSVHARERLKALQIGTPVPLSVVYVARVPGALVRDIEGTVHAELKAHHLGGEWFAIDVEQARAAIDRAHSQIVFREGGMRALAALVRRDLATDKDGT